MRTRWPSCGVLTRRAVSSVILGTRTLEQLDGDLAAAGLALSAEETPCSTRPATRAPGLPVRRAPAAASGPRLPSCCRCAASYGSGTRTRPWPHPAGSAPEGVPRVGGWVRGQDAVPVGRAPALSEVLRDGSGRCSGPPLLVL